MGGWGGGRVGEGWGGGEGGGRAIGESESLRQTERLTRRQIHAQKQSHVYVCCALTQPKQHMYVTAQEHHK